MKRAGISLLLAGVLLALVQFTGCADKPATFNRVTILAPSGAQIIGQGQTVSIQVSVLNDTATGGVTFAPVVFGTLTQTSTTTATYSAPNPVTAETVVKIVITSVDFPNQSTTLIITVEPPPTITTTSLPTAPLNGAYNAPVTATGGVPPLSWSITAGALPAGLKLSNSTTGTVQITGKATAAGSATFTITVTDAAAGDPPASQQLTIVVSSLAISTTSPLPPGTVGTAYDTPGLQFTATGGTGTDTWTVASGSTLPAGLSLSSTGVLSGTPTVGGTFTFGITATDSANPPAVVTSTFTLVTSQEQQLNLLNGSYAFEFSGYGTNGFVAFAGTFTANGLGGITTGEIDFNSQLGAPLNFPNLLGSYTLGTDGRGTLTFTNTTLPTVPIFAFSIDANGNGRFIESDSSGTRGSGRIQLQTVTSCVVNSTGTSTFAGDFAFGGSGFASAAATNGAGPLAFAGRFTAVPPVTVSIPGSLAQGEMDTNTPGLVTIRDNSVSGSYNSGPDSTHCTLALTSASLDNPNFSVYPISSSDAFIIETDTVSGATPYISAGEMIQQIGQPFVTSGVLSGTMVGGLSGQIISGGTFSPEVQVVQTSSTSGSPSFQILQEDNQAGTIFGTNGTATTDPYTSDSLGRVQGSIEFNSFFEPVFYLINTNQAFCVNIVQNAPIFGYLAPQSAGPFSALTIKSTSLIDGTSAPAVSADRDLSGFLSFDGISVVGGTQDQSTTSSNSSATVTGTYVLNATGTTDGSGTMTLSTPTGFTGYFFIVSPTNVVVITTTPLDTNPVLIIIGH
ncbi:MAG: Ig domain-containing protein [Candidatus Acidiferrales bacterium]